MLASRSRELKTGFRKGRGGQGVLREHHRKCVPTQGTTSGIARLSGARKGRGGASKILDPRHYYCVLSKLIILLQLTGKSRVV